MNPNTPVVQQKRDIRALIQSEATKAQIALVLPKHLTADRMARVACTAILKTPKLADCRPESLLQALMLCSQAGLEPDGRNAHLIPFGDQVQVIFDYKGLVALAERNGVESIYADRICDNDAFDYQVIDGEKKLSHKVDWKKPRGHAYAYYASCRRNGRLDVEVMTKDDVDAIRKRSRAANGGPWVTDYDEMAKKTVLRRMSKRWDLNPEVADAIIADDDTPLFRAPSPVAASETAAPIFSLPPPAAPARVADESPTPAHDPDDDVPMGEAASPAASTTTAPTPAVAPAEISPEVQATMNKLAELCVASGISEDQVVAYSKKNKLAGSAVTTIAQMANNKRNLLITEWSNIVEKIKEV